jgi:DNA polymerase-4
MNKPRTILHFDLDAFFCSVEELHDPSLRGKPFVVGGDASGRGVVTSASYAARPFGVRSAMPTSQALRLCPGLRVVGRATAVWANVRACHVPGAPDGAGGQRSPSTSLVLDVSEQARRAVAEELHRAIAERFSLPTSWGVATNKLVAKIATKSASPVG